MPQFAGLDMEAQILHLNFLLLPKEDPLQPPELQMPAIDAMRLVFPAEMHHLCRFLEGMNIFVPHSASKSSLLWTKICSNSRHSVRYLPSSVAAAACLPGYQIFYSAYPPALRLMGPYKPENLHRSRAYLQVLGLLLSQLIHVPRGPPSAALTCLFVNAPRLNELYR